MDGVTVLDAAAVPAPPAFDAVDHVTRSLAAVPWPHEVEVRVDLPLDDVRRRVGATLAELGDAGDGWTLVHMRVQSLDWMAAVLAGLGCAFEVVRPDALRDHVRVLAERLLQHAGG